MMIKNFNLLANTEVKKKALKILEAGLVAAQPKNFLKAFVNKNNICWEKIVYLYQIIEKFLWLRMARLQILWQNMYQRKLMFQKELL